MWYFWGGPVIAAFCFLIIAIIFFYGFGSRRHRDIVVVDDSTTYTVRPYVVTTGQGRVVTQATVVSSQPATNGVIVTNPENAVTAREMANRESPPPAVVVVNK
jgi:hypothetical protein